ncbi:hypothetical protein E2C01_054199 [Portunus trituberculatus]|uniref:Uncharacterized protein n=1 Tax=Portunus trituberculatus TaxID=210409 RepID=A0A5B7GJ94_PORTR|nr:hypothetical protein [Portunus trituberculatus]
MEQCSAFSYILHVPPFTYDVKAWFLHFEAVHLHLHPSEVYTHCTLNQGSNPNRQGSSKSA